MVQGRGHQGGAAWGRDIIVRWGIAACRRRLTWAWQIQPYPRLITTIAVSLPNLVSPTLPSHMRCRVMVLLRARPSSQIACSVGGNVAENSGGVHCLKYGLTTNNLLGIEMVTMDGEILRLGGKHLDAGDYDLLGVMTGSKGCLAWCPR